MKRIQTIYIGDLIFKLRNARQLSQDELAFRSSLSRKYMSKLESNPSNPTISTISSIATGLGMKPSELLFEIGKVLDKENTEDKHVSDSD